MPQADRIWTDECAGLDGLTLPDAARVKAWIRRQWKFVRVTMLGPKGPEPVKKPRCLRARRKALAQLLSSGAQERRRRVSRLRVGRVGPALDLVEVW